MPEIDRAIWTVRVESGDPVSAKIGAGRKPVVSDPSLRIENLSGANQDARNIAVLELPARKLGRSHFRAGDTVELSSTLQTHAKSYRVVWEGDFKLK